MEYAEALKQVQAIKPKENFIVIELSYDHKLVMPYKDGIAFMATLGSAERLQDPYGGQHRISEFDRNSVVTRVLSHAEYTRIKIAALLGVKPEELIQMAA